MRVLVIGYGMAGARLVAEVRSRDRAGHVQLTVLGAEPHRPYNRILLSGLLAGETTEADLTLSGPGPGCDIRLGDPAVAIDREARTVTTARGDIVAYDHLILATGSRAIVPSIAGLPDDDVAMPVRVAVFRTLDDCRRIVAAARSARSALVLGGGLLGLEAARGLAGRGLLVDVVHAVGHLMERQLDPAAGAVLSRTLQALGITTHLGAAATAIEESGTGVTLTLADGRRLSADQLVLACGVRPDTALAAKAGLAVGRGIVCDDRLRTSDPAISAVGDCADPPGGGSGLVAPAWDQARVVADLVTGADPSARYRPAPAVTRLKAAGIDLATMGESCDGADAVTFADPDRGLYAKLVVRDDRLAGAIMLGEHPTVGTVIQHFDRQTPLPADRRGLLLGRFLHGAGAPASDSPALMPDSALVCRCNSVTKGAIRRAWLEGVRDVSAATTASTGCGSCRDAVDGICAWLSTQDSREVVAR
jgi:assimilatory nitrate reductase electron transfer subunit